jgi:thiazole tautomerase (transcriptional regulator TenI)
LAQVANTVSVPVVAIGGITLERVGEVASSGASAVAVISGILQAPNPSEQAQKIKQAFLANANFKTF